MANDIDANRTDERLVDDGKHGHDVLVLRLTDEFGEGTDIVERALGIRDAHDSIEEVDRAQLARMVVPVLTPWHGVQVEVDSESVLARPGDGEEEVLPADEREEGLAVVRLDHPVADGQADPVETGCCDLGKILLRLCNTFSSVHGTRGRREERGLTIKVA